MTNIDVSTNLPELPENRFWRISKAKNKEWPFYLEICEYFPMTWFDRTFHLKPQVKQVDGVYIKHDWGTTRIQQAARKLLYENTVRMEESIVGDYPPKRLI